MLKMRCSGEIDSQLGKAVKKMIFDNKHSDHDLDAFLLRRSLEHRMRWALTQPYYRELCRGSLPEELGQLKLSVSTLSSSTIDTSESSPNQMCTRGKVSSRFSFIFVITVEIQNETGPFARETWQPGVTINLKEV